MGGKVFHKIGLGTEGLGLSGHIYYPNDVQCGRKTVFMSESYGEVSPSASVV